MDCLSENQHQVSLLNHIKSPNEKISVLIVAKFKPLVRLNVVNRRGGIGSSTDKEHIIALLFVDRSCIFWATLYIMEVTFWIFKDYISVEVTVIPDLY